MECSSPGGISRMSPGFSRKVTFCTVAVSSSSRGMMISWASCQWVEKALVWVLYQKRRVVWAM